MVCLALVLLAQSKPIDIDLPIRPARTVLERISTESGLKIEHTGIAQLPILVKAKQIDPKLLLEKIARVTDSDLMLINGGYRLSHGANRISAAAQEEAADLAKRLEKSLDEKRDALKERLDWSDKKLDERADSLVKKVEEAMKNNTLRENDYMNIMFGDDLDMPASLVLAKLYSLPASTWVGAPGTVIRLSDRPNRFQRPLKVDMNPIYAQYISAHNRMVTQTQSRIQNTHVSFGLENRQLSTGDVNRTVVMANWVYPGYVGLSVLLVDKESNVVGSVSQSLPLSPADSMKAEFGEDSTEIAVPPITQAISKAILNEAARTSNSSVSMMSDDGVAITLGRDLKAPKQTAEVIERLCADKDPYEDVLGTALRARAEAKNEALVASFPADALAQVARLGLQPKFKMSELGKVLADRDVMVEEADGVLVVRPRLSADIDRNQADRAALRTLCQSISKQGYARMDQLAAYVATRPGRIARENLDHLWLRALNSVEANLLAESQDGLRLYAGLPADIKKRTDFKGPLTGALANLAYNRLSTYIGTSVVIGPGIAIGISSEKTPNKLGRYDLSELLVDGVPELSFKQTEQPALFVQRNSEGSGKFASVKELGVYRALSKSSRFTEFASELMPYDSYRPATSRVVQMTLSIAEGPNSYNTSTSDRLSDNVASTDKGPWSWQTLPDEFKKAILDAEEKLGSRWGGGQASMR